MKLYSILAALIATLFSSAVHSQEFDFNLTASPAELLSMGTPDDVSSDGSYRYQVPFELPEFKGLEPSIGLTYNSAQRMYGASGPIVGVGWSVSGLSVIERQSIGGGVASFVDREDVFVLDGQILLACNDSNAISKYTGGSGGLPRYPSRFNTTNFSASCDAGGQFVTQMDDGRKITVRSLSADGVSFPEFTVTQQDGTQYKYVSAGLARQASGYQPPNSSDTTNGGLLSRYYGSRFVLSEIRDTQSSPNRVTFKYRGTTGSADLSTEIHKIEYAGYDITFNYRNNSTLLRSSGSGHSGMTHQTRRYLANVEITDGNTHIRAYELKQNESSFLSHKRLISTQEFGSDYRNFNVVDIDSGSSLPKTTFSYQEDSFGYRTSSYTLPDFKGRAAFVGDFDDDGRDEFVISIPRRRTKSDVVATSGLHEQNIYHFGDDKTVTIEEDAFSIHQLRIQDRDGPDFTSAGTSSVYSPVEGRFLPNFSTRWQSSNLGRSISVRPTDASGASLDGFSFGLLNSDRRQIYSPNLDRDPEPEMILKPYANYSPPTAVYDFIARGYKSLELNTEHLDFFARDDLRVVVGDFDGNGLSDFLSHNRMHLNFERGFEQYPASIIADGGEFDFSRREQVHVADMNSDGLDDFIYLVERESRDRELSIAYSYGSGFGTPVEIPLPAALPDPGFAASSQNVQFRDLNSDGLPDFILRNGGGDAYVMLWNGQGFRAVANFSDNNNLYHYNIRGIGDFDGDGLVDFFRSSSSNHKVSFGDGEVPNLLSSVRNPQGLKISVAYASSRDGEKANSVVSGNAVPGTRQIVEAVTTSDHWNPAATTSYYYRDAKFDHVWQRSLGFGKVIEVLPMLPGETNHVSITREYENSDFRTAGRMIRETRSEGTAFPYNSKVLHETVNNWSAIGAVPASPPTGTSRAAFVTTPTGGAKAASGGPFRAVLNHSYQRTANDNGYVATGETYKTNGYGLRYEVTDLGALRWNASNRTYADPSSSDNISVRSHFKSNLDKFIIGLPYSVSTYESGAFSSDNSNWLYRTLYQYDGDAYAAVPTRGNVTRVRRMTWNGEPQNSTHGWVVEQTNTYDSKGNVLTTTDANNSKTTFTYARGLFRTSTKNALNHTASQTWDYRCQKPLVETDANGQRTVHTYDALCRVVSTTNPSGSKTKFEYANFGTTSQAFVTRYPTGSTTSSQAERAQYHYFDGFGRHLLTSDAGGVDGLDDRRYRRTRFDARGRVIAESRPMTRTEDVATGRSWRGSSNPTQFAIYHKYDNLDRLIETIHLDGNKETTAYSTVQKGIARAQYGTQGDIRAGYLATTYKDAHCYDAGSESTVCGTVRFTTNTAGQVFEEFRWDNNGSDIGAGRGAAIKNYEYDELGHLVGVKDESGARWTYTYDTAGRRLTADDPGLGNWTMQYDRVGNLIRQTDSKGQTITWTYDALNRVTSKSTPDETTTYSYDQGRLGFYNLGQLTTVKNNVHRIQYDFNKLGLSAREQHFVGNSNGTTADYTFETDYLSNGAVKNLYMPLTNGAAPSVVGPFDYDKSGRVKSFAGHIDSITYDQWENPIRKVFGTGVVEERAYDADRGWLDSIHLYQRNGTAMSVPILYDRTGTGRVARKYDTAAQSDGRVGEWESYRYDYAGRLLSAADGDTSLEYRYDRAGRIRYNSDLGEYVYPGHREDHVHAPKQVGTESFTYDANGNMLTGLFGKVMTYDAENRPKSVTFNGDRTEYVYGADGARLKLVENVGTSQEAETLYVGQIEVRDYDTSDAIVFAYPHPEVRLVDGEVSHLHRDQLNSVARVSVKWGNQGRIATYHPFGEPEYDYQNRGIGYPDAHGFIGERYDDDAGLQYLNARYYDPKLGLFLQPDWYEVTEPGVGTNRYSYSFNDPVNNLDPTGNACVPCVVVAGIAAYFGSTDPGNAPGPDDTALPQNGMGGAIETITPIGDIVAMGEAETIGQFGAAVAGLALPGNIPVARAIPGGNRGASSPVSVAGANGLSKNDNPVDLVGFRRDHIMNRHAPGTGKPGKTEFPASWDEQRILHNISDVATDPASRRVTSRHGTQVYGIRDGVEIRVDLYPSNHPRYPNHISTGFPVAGPNVSVNP